MNNGIRGTVTNPEVIYGKSAYEIAVMHGFDGTEEEWIKSCRVDADRAEKAANEAAEKATEAATAEVTRLVGELGIVQETGDSETSVMSQKAVTNEVNSIKCNISECGISSIIASGTAEAVAPAYADTTVVSGISLKKGKSYRYSVSVSTDDTDKKSVWTTLYAGGTAYKSLTIKTATLDNGYLDFIADNDYDNAYICFKTEPTSGYSITASIEVLADCGTEKYCPNTEFIADNFVNGDATFWSGGASPNYRATYRVMCTLATMYKYAQEVYIKAADGFRFSIGYYNDGAVTDGGWQTEITVPANQQFRIMIARVSEDTSETADIAEFVSKIRIFTNGLKEIYNLAKNSGTPEGTTNTEIRYIPVKPFEVLSINHRGYNTVAPENTLAAFKLSKKNGFDFVECDVRFTSDGVPVLLHDPSINRTARNADGSEISSTINIADITYETALTYDFGILKGETYRGTKIPTLAEFMQLCRALSLHPYLDVYDAHSNTKAQTICDIVKSCGMERNVSFISSSYAALSYISNILPNARYGLVSWDTDPTTGLNVSNYIDVLKEKGVGNMFVDADLSVADISLYKALCEQKGVSLEVYCPNTVEKILTLDTYITGVTSDTLIAKDVLREGNLE